MKHAHHNALRADGFEVGAIDAFHDRARRIRQKHRQ
jgi:hypothetical protein